MFYMFGMLKFQVPEAEVIYLVVFLHITYLSLFLRCGHRSPWLEPITSAMLRCYELVLSTLAVYALLVCRTRPTSNAQQLTAKSKLILL